MLHVNYDYRKKDGTIHSATNYFYDINKTVRFVYMIVKSKDKRLVSYGADDSEELEELNRKIHL